MIVAKFPKQGRQIQVGSVEVGDFRPISQKWCKIGTQLLYNTNCRKLLNVIRSIEWCYFQWRWMTHNYLKHPIFNIFRGFLTQTCIPPGLLNLVPASAGGKGGIHVRYRVAGNTVWFHMACEFPVAVKAKLMLTAIHCLLLLYLLFISS